MPRIEIPHKRVQSREEQLVVDGHDVTVEAFVERYTHPLISLARYLRGKYYYKRHVRLKFEDEPLKTEMIHERHDLDAMDWEEAKKEIVLRAHHVIEDTERMIEMDRP